MNHFIILPITSPKPIKKNYNFYFFISIIISFDIYYSIFIYINFLQNLCQLFILITIIIILINIELIYIYIKKKNKFNEYLYILLLLNICLIIICLILISFFI